MVLYDVLEEHGRLLDERRVGFGAGEGRNMQRGFAERDAWKRLDCCPVRVKQ